MFGAEHPYTQLVPKLVGVDPDDAFSAVPYEKGSTLLFYLEQKLGGPDVFEPFLRAYIDKFKYKSITTDDWKAFLYEFFNDKVGMIFRKMTGLLLTLVLMGMIISTNLLN